WSLARAPKGPVVGPGKPTLIVSPPCALRIAGKAATAAPAAVVARNARRFIGRLLGESGADHRRGPLACQTQPGRAGRSHFAPTRARAKAGRPARPPRSSTRSTTRWPRSARWSPTNPSRPSACSGPSGACGAREWGRVPLGKVPYRSVDALLSRALAAEDPATAALMGELACVRRRGWFTRGEFLR